MNYFFRASYEYDTSDYSGFITYGLDINVELMTRWIWMQTIHGSKQTRITMQKVWPRDEDRRP